MNTFGQLFRVTTFGESHGPAIGCVIDGCPPGVTISPDDFRDDLARRATGRTRHTSQRHEADEVEIISGVYEGRTTGTPIALLVRNTDAKSKDYDAIAQTFRPGHADYTYWQKYGHRDPRGGGRSSARETTMRVAAAVLAKRWLNEKFGVRVRGHLAQIGNVVPRGFDWSAVEGNPFFWPDASQVPELEAYMDALRKSGDSVGARITVCADGVPPGWGEPIYGKLDGELAAALMSINAVKGVEVGDGFAVVAQHGTEHRDEISETGFFVKPRRRHPRRHFHRAASGRVGGVQADFEPALARAQPGHGRPARRSGHHRSPRPLRGRARHAHLRGDGRPRADGPGPAPSRAVRRCRRRVAAHRARRGQTLSRARHPICATPFIPQVKK